MRVSLKWRQASADRLAMRREHCTSGFDPMACRLMGHIIGRESHAQWYYPGAPRGRYFPGARDFTSSNQFSTT